MEHKIMYTSDLHQKGHRVALKSIVSLEKPDSLILGGDLSSIEKIDPDEQEHFFKTEFPEIMSVIKNMGTSVYLIPGNDDLRIFKKYLDKHDGNLWNNISSKRANIAEFEIVGYPYIPLTPFQAKDYEKFDLKPIEKKGLRNWLFGNVWVAPDAVLEGLVYTDKGWLDKSFDKKNVIDTIEEDLEKEIFISNPDKTIYVFHCPPYNTPLDRVMPMGNHVGSKAISNFITEASPYLVFTAHIHETVDVSREFSHKMNNTTIVTAGNGHEKSLNYVVMDLYNKENAVRKKFKC